MVREKRDMTFVEGSSKIAFKDVASKIDATSVTLEMVDTTLAVEILEQNYAFDLVGPEKIYSKYVDHRVDIVTEKGEAFLTGAHIPPYQPENTPKDYESRRPRKLLLTKNELKKIVENKKSKGLTMVPISMYNKHGKIKVDIAIVRGKKKHDKRETIKKRDVMRDVAREVKYR